MSSHAVIGIQWGDEGKGKIIDRLAEGADVVVRCQGGNNAGHTVVAKGERFVLNLIPCGILHAGVRNVIGNGVVIDPEHLFKEVEGLRARGVEVEGRLFVSSRAHLILPFHRELDLLVERFKAAGRIGTTGRGIGPAYADKAARVGIRVADTLDEARLAERLRSLLAEKNLLLQRCFEAPTQAEAPLFEKLVAFGRKVRPLVVDAGALVRRAIQDGQRVLFEGAQGTMLDLDAGTYPYVTSSCTTSAGICAGAGISPRALHRVIGVAKAYSTRVGEGPFPTGLQGERDETLRTKGREYGATTGRPRRTGWFDAVAARYAIELNGVDEVIVTNLDVLSGYGPLKVAVAYQVGSERRETYPADLADIAQAEPIYRDFEGWTEDLTGLRRIEQLPPAARRYIDFLEERIGAPIAEVSVGPDRSQMIPRAR